jgi:hypothetical protein
VCVTLVMLKVMLCLAVDARILVTQPLVTGKPLEFVRVYEDRGGVSCLSPYNWGVSSPAPEGKGTG